MASEVGNIQNTFQVTWRIECNFCGMSTFSLVLFLRERKGVEFKTYLDKFRGEKEEGEKAY